MVVACITHWDCGWKDFICYPNKLGHEIHGRIIAFQRIQTEMIQNLKCKRWARILECCWKDSATEKLYILRYSPLTHAPSDCTSENACGWHNYQFPEVWDKIRWLWSWNAFGGFVNVLPVGIIVVIKWIFKTVICGGLHVDMLPICASAFPGMLTQVYNDSEVV